MQILFIYVYLVPLSTMFELCLCVLVIIPTWPVFILVLYSDMVMAYYTSIIYIFCLG